MKKIYKSFVAITCLILAFVSIALVGCNNTKVEKITLNKTSLNLVVGNSETLTATITPDEAKDETITWSTDNDKVATVANGKVTAVAKGEATITAKAGDQSATCTVTVTEAPATVAVTSVTLNKESTSIAVGAKETLTVTVAPDNATNKNVTWKSSDTTIATVSNTGEVTGVKEGKAIITVTSAADTSLTDTCEVTVTAAAPSTTTTDFLSLPSTALKIGDTSFENETATGKKLAIAKDTTNTDTRVEIYKATGAAKAFTAAQSTAFGKVKIDNKDITLTEKDSYISLALNLKSETSVKMGWVDSATTAVTAQSAGYKTKVDGELILWVNRPNRTNFYRIEVGNNNYVLDISGLDVLEFVKKETDSLNFTNASGNKPFKNEDNLKIEKRLTVKDSTEIYDVTGDATAFTTETMKEFFGNNSLTEVNNHKYIVLDINLKAGDKWNGGWVKNANDSLVANTSVEYKAHTAKDPDANALFLWVTNPKAAGLNYFRIEYTGSGSTVTRSYVLDLSKLNIGNNILTAAEGTWDKLGNQLSNDDPKGFENENDLIFTAEGNITKITGRATEYTPTNAKEIDSVDGNQRPSGEVGTSNPGESKCDAVIDEYIVLEIKQDLIKNGVKMAYGWVRNPNTELCAGNSAGTNAEWGCNADCEGVREWDIKESDSNGVNSTGIKDNKLILWVTRQGISGYYLRLEFSLTDDSSANKTVKRAYVYDLRDLVSDRNKNERVQDFFKVENGEVKVGSSEFHNGVGSDLKIDKVEGKENYWKISGKATKFSDSNKSAFGSEVSDKDKSGYVVFRMNVKKKSTNSSNNITDKITFGWIDASNVGNVQDTDLNNKKELNSYGWNEAMVMLVNRSGRDKQIWCVIVEDDGGKNYYYLDFSGISTTATDFCADDTAST